MRSHTVVIQDHAVTTESLGRGGINRLVEGLVQPIVAPLWLGAERRGVDLGAWQVENGLRRRWERGYGSGSADRLLPTIEIPVAEPADAEPRLHRRTLEFQREIADVNRRLDRIVRDSINQGALALVLGGDHALATGSISGALQTTDKLGVLWFDTHGDVNTPETSPSGHIHGMPLALAMGYGADDLLVPPATVVLEPNTVCLLGVRDLDPGEQRFIANHDIWMLTMEEWTDVGLLEGLDAALHHLLRQGVTAVHVSFDLDVLDPLELPGTGTPVPGGLTYREASQILRYVRAWEVPIRSADWVELNPLLDLSGHSTTVAVSLLATFLGESVR
jgi:arginase